MINFKSSNLFSIYTPSAIAGAAACINISYIAIIGFNTKYYKRKQFQSRYFNEATWACCCLLLYSCALIILCKDLWDKFGYDIGLSFVAVLLSWLPGRILCILYQYDTLEVYKDSKNWLCPLSCSMMFLRFSAAIVEVISIVWISLSLYLFSDSYNADTNIFNAIRVSAIVIAVLFCIGCNIWWCIVGIVIENPTNSALQEELIDSKELLFKSHTLPLIRVTERQISYSFLFTWFTPVLANGAKRLLHLSDLPLLPSTLHNVYSAAQLQAESLKSFMYVKYHRFNSASEKIDEDALIDNWIPETDKATPIKSYKALLRLLWRVHGYEFLFLGILKFLTCLSSFAGPLLLGAMVSYVGDANGSDDLLYGLYLVFALGVSFLVSAGLNTASNIKGTILQTKVKGALTKLVFMRAMNLPMYAWTDMALTDAKLITMIQVDAERVADAIKSLHDLWTLPIQLIVAFVLLYQEVRIGFIVGVLLIVAMIPLNTVIASKINNATATMMKYKDARNRVISEAIRGIRSLKMLGLEQFIFEISNRERKNELKYLSIRKYLDAACVFLWASTPIIVPFATFSLTALTGRHLSASEVFTAVALLNMLIFPMNAFPWVVNGAVEARVSTIRIASVLSNSNGDNLLLAAGTKVNRDNELQSEIDAPNTVSSNNNNSSTTPGKSVRRNSSNLHRPVLVSCSSCVWLWGKRYTWSEMSTSIVQQIASTSLGESFVGKDANAKVGPVIRRNSQSGKGTSPQTSEIAHTESNTNIDSGVWVANPMAYRNTETGTEVPAIDPEDRICPENAVGNDQWDMFPDPSTSPASENKSPVTRKPSIRINVEAEGCSASLWTANPMTPGSHESVLAHDVSSVIDSFIDENDAHKGWRVGSENVVTHKIKSTSTDALDPISSRASPLARRPSSTSEKLTSKLFRTSFSSSKVENNNEVNCDAEAFWLGPISLRARAGEFWGVVGAVASGKSSLLLGILEEIRLVHGNVDWYTSNKQPPFPPSYAQSKAAYCGQVATLHSGTIRDNILMGLPFVASRYEVVLNGCGLDVDMQAANWPLKDLTDVGESSGTALSGGQKLRVGIARAIYSSAEVLLLDDPFSALDTVTATALMRFLLQYVCRHQERLVFVATHSVSLLQEADNIIVLKSGVMMEHGTFQSLANNSHFNSLLGKSELHQQQNVASSTIHLPAQKIVHLNTPTDGAISGNTDRGGGAGFTDLDDEGYNDSKPLLYSQHDDANINDSDIPDEKSIADIYGAEDSEERQEMEIIQSGKIDSTVYRAYARAVGWGLTVCILLSTIFMQASSSIYIFWLAYWVSHEGQFSHGEFVGISAAIVGINIICAIFRSYLFAKGGLNAAQAFYSKLTTSIFNTKLRFFEITSFGKIINRFGKDTNTIDDQLPFIVNIVLAQVFLMLGSFVVISISDPIVIVVIILVMVIYYQLQKFYRNSSRMLRRLDSAYRSPVFSLMFDCASNAVCLRAMNAFPRFEVKLEKAVDNSLRTSLSIAVASQWLGMRLQLLGALVATSLALSAALTAAYDVLPVSAGILGLSLSYSFSIVSNLNGLVGSLTETEQEMVSVERVQEFVNLESETDKYGSNSQHPRSNNYDRDFSRQSTDIALTTRDSVNGYLKLDQDIESNTNKSDSAVGVYDNLHLYGDIEFNNVTMRYSSELPLALNGITTTVPAGSKVAIIGRTGSGKSSLLRVLLRLNEYGGSIKIGGVDISTLPLHELRRKLIVIPQDPVLLSASIRLNLDPTGEKYNDDQLILALQASGFVWTLSSLHWKEIRAHSNKVNSDENDDEENPTNVQGDMKYAKYGTSKSSFGDNDDIQWGHWLQRKHSGDLGGAIVSNEDLQQVLNWELINAGDNLSQGQKQLLSLARALLPLKLNGNIGNPNPMPSRRSSKGSGMMSTLFEKENNAVADDDKIVLIDEATASIDPAAEAALVSVLSKYFSGTGSNNKCTVIMICHREDGIRKLCNKELRMAEGQIEYFVDVDNVTL